MDPPLRVNHLPARRARHGLLGACPPGLRAPGIQASGQSRAEPAPTRLGARFQRVSCRVSSRRATARPGVVADRATTVVATMRASGLGICLPLVGHARNESAHRPCARSTHRPSPNRNPQSRRLWPCVLTVPPARPARPPAPGQRRTTLVASTSPRRRDPPADPAPDREPTLRHGRARRQPPLSVRRTPV
jgi:hypothetical protein